MSPAPLTEDNRAADAQERHASQAAELGVVARDVADPAHDGKDGAERQEAVVVPAQRGESLGAEDDVRALQEDAVGRVSAESQ